jgi:hypothetical protein
MASITACINNLVSARLMTQAQGANLATVYQQMVQAGVPQPQQAAIQAVRTAAQRQRYLAALQAQFIAKLSNQALSHPKGVGAGVNSILATDLTGKASWDSVDAAQRAISATYTSQLAEAVDAMRFTKLGFAQDRQLVDNIVRELFGQSSGNADAARYAQKIAKMFEDMRTRFNEAGGDIPKRADWGLPQKHDGVKIRKMGQAAWKGFITPLLNRQQMLNQFGVPMSNAELDAALDEVFETITTNGLNKLVPGQPGGRKLANQHQDHRFLVFDGPDKWLEYDKAVGGGNPFFTMVEHIRSMSDDIALLEVMGPNPTQAFRVLKDLAKKNGVEGLDLQMIDGRWMDVSGDRMGQTPISLRSQEVLAGIRNALTSMRLGSAILSSVSDLAFMRQAAAWNGLSTTRLMSEMLSQLNPANAGHRLEAAQAAANIEEWLHFASHAHRFSEVTGTGATARASDLTMRLSGMNLWTGAARRAVAMEFLMTAAENSGKAFNDLSPEFRRALEMGGIDANDWAKIATIKRQRANGVEMIDMERLYNDPSLTRAEQKRLTRRMTSAMEMVTTKAIPAPDSNTRAIFNLSGAPGTVSGEAAKSVLQFKSFGISVIQQHVLAGIHQGTLGGAMTYLGALTVYTTLMGGLALQLKEISKGRSPRKQDEKFWAEAIFQGGGYGIFGDFIQSGMFGVNRFGGSLAETVAGPTLGALTDVAKVTTGQIGRAVEGEDLNFEQGALGKLGSYTPIVGSLWYTRVPFERYVVNQLQERFDPKARRRWAAEERRRRNDFDQTLWWRKGEMTPDSAPVEF